MEESEQTGLIPVTPDNDDDENTAAYFSIACRPCAVGLSDTVTRPRFMPLWLEKLVQYLTHLQNSVRNIFR